MIKIANQIYTIWVKSTEMSCKIQEQKKKEDLKKQVKEKKKW